MQDKLDKWYEQFDAGNLTWENYGRLLDRIEVLECREVQYQKLILLGITLITVKQDLLEAYRAMSSVAWEELERH